MIAPTAAVTIFKHANNGFVQWKLFWPTAVGACLFAYFASDLVKTLSNETLTRIFGGVMIVIGCYMLLKKA